MEISPDQEPPEGHFNFPVPELNFNLELTTTQVELQEERTNLYRHKLVGNYDNSEFPGLIASLKESIKQHKNPKDHPGFISEGFSSAVFAVHTNDGEKYAVRMPEFCSHNAITGSWHRDIEDYVKPFSLGEGLEGLEQPVAASTKDNVIISPYIEGATLEDITAEDFLTITPEHIQRFVDSVSAATDNGILIDHGLDNFILAKNEGIISIDYIENDDTNYAKNKIESLTAVFNRLLRQENFDNLRERRVEVCNTIEEGISGSTLDANQKRLLRNTITNTKNLRHFF